MNVGAFTTLATMQYILLRHCAYFKMSNISNTSFLKLSQFFFFGGGEGNEKFFLTIHIVRILCFFFFNCIDYIL